MCGSWASLCSCLCDVHTTHCHAGLPRCPGFQGRVLRHSSAFHLHRLHLSWNSIMQSSFPPYPGSWFPTHSSNLASAPFSFASVPAWPSWPFPSPSAPGVTRWCYFPIKCPPLHRRTALGQGFHAVWVCDEAFLGEQLRQVVRGLGPRCAFSLRSVFLKQSCSLWLNQPVPCLSLRSQKGWTASTQLLTTLLYAKPTLL